MSESSQPKNWTMGTLTITAGALAAYTVAVEQGNLALSGLTAAQREAILVEDRGVFSTLITGKQKYVGVSFTAYLRDLTDATDVTLVGICLRLGAHVAATSTLGANRPYTTDFLWTMDGTSQGDSANHTVTLEDVRWEEVTFAEGDINTVTMTGVSYGAMTMT